MAEIIGGKELEKLFKEAPSKVAKQAIDIGLNRGVKIASGAIKRSAPVRTGRLKRSIKIKKITRSRSQANERLRFLLGTTGKGWVGHFIEFGTGDRFTKGRRVWRGRVKANPFFKPAFDESFKQIEEAIVSGAAGEADRLMDKLAGRYDRLTAREKRLL